MAKKKSPKLNKRKYALKKRTPFDNKLLPVIESLSAEGRSLADIGMLLGYTGKNPSAWVSYLKNKHPEVAAALEAGTKTADTKLVVTAFDVATGYDVEEEEIEYVNCPKIDAVGNTRAHYVERSRKTKRKFIKPDSSLLFKLLCNRLPEYFSDIKKFEVNKQSIHAEIDMNKEIASFAGKLMQTAQKRKQVKSKQVETDEQIQTV